MALATDSDVEAALGRTLESTEDVSNLLDTASDLVVGYLGTTPSPVPPAVSRVVADMVAAVLTKPDVTTAQYDASGYNQIREDASVRVGVESLTSTGPWLTKSQKTRLAPYATGNTGVRLVSDRYA